jgi:predicted permease
MAAAARGMGQLVFVLVVSIGSIAVGYAVQRVLTAFRVADVRTLGAISRVLKLGSFFFLNPVAILSTFWGLALPSPSVLAFPLLGLLSVLLGAAGAMAAIRIFRVPPEQAASVFTCGVFSNVVTFGGLIAYTMFAEAGYGLAQLFTVLMSPAYYMIGYPVSSNIARGEERVLRVSSENLKENPYLVIPLIAIGAGVLLRVAGVPRPAELGGLVAVLVPCVAAALGVAIGLTLHFSRIGGYRRDILIVLAIRHALVPLVMIPLAAALGFGAVAGGLALKIVAILSVMPVAFNALVPPAIYGFDLDLANSAWIASTSTLVLAVPVLFWVL